MVSVTNYKRYPLIFPERDPSCDKILLATELTAKCLFVLMISWPAGSGANGQVRRFVFMGSLVAETCHSSPRALHGSSTGRPDAGSSVGHALLLQEKMITAHFMFTLTIFKNILVLFILMPCSLRRQASSEGGKVATRLRSA